jgi:hypothetical protein
VADAQSDANLSNGLSEGCKMEASETQVETTTTCQGHNLQSWIQPLFFTKALTLLENPDGLVPNSNLQPSKTDDKVEHFLKVPS